MKGKNKMDGLLGKLAGLGIIVVLIVAILLPMKDSTSDMGEDINADLNNARVALTDDTIFTAAEVQYDLDNASYTVTVVDDNGASMANLNGIPDNAHFELSAETFDDYGNTSSRTYKFKPIG